MTVPVAEKMYERAGQQQDVRQRKQDVGRMRQQQVEADRRKRERDR